jgi:hypothetical protein
MRGLHLGTASELARSKPSLHCLVLSMVDLQQPRALPAMGAGATAANQKFSLKCKDNPLGKSDF